MASTISQSNLAPIKSAAIKNQISPSPLSTPKSTANYTSMLGTSTIGNPTRTQSAPLSWAQTETNQANQPMGTGLGAPSGSPAIGPGIKGALGGLGQAAGNIGHFFNNLYTGASGGYNGTASTPSPGTSPVPTNSPSTGTIQGANTGTTSGGATQPLPNGGVTAGGGSYAGPASSNPNGIPASSTSTPAPVQNQGFGTSTGGINSGSSAPAQGSSAPTISATPNYAAGQGYAAGGAPVQTNPANTYGTGLNTQINYANGSGNSAVNTSVGGLQGQASNTPQSQAQGYLQGVAQNGTPAVDNANQALSNFTSGAGNLLNEMQSDPSLTAGISSGITANVANALTTNRQALSTQAQNALTGQSNQIGAAENAGGLANTNQSNQITAGSNAGTTAQNQQSAQIGAAGNATGQAAPVSGATFFGSPTNSGSVVGSNGGSSNPVSASLINTNIASGQQLQSDLNTIGSQLPAFTSNMNYLTSLGSQGGINSSSPILTQLQQKFGTSVGGANSPQVQSFLTQLQSVQSQYQQMTGDSSFTIPTTVTGSQLQALQQQMNANIQNVKAGKQAQLDKLTSGSNTTGGNSNNGSSVSGFGWSGN
jgi:hypothetical protein